MFILWNYRKYHFSYFRFFCSALPYINITSPLYEIWLTICIISGIIISVYLILYRNKSLSTMILRFIILVISSTVIMLFNGYVGIVRFLYRILNLNTCSANDNVSGMLSFTFYSLVIFVCIIAILFMAIRKIYHNTIKDKWKWCY